METRNNHKYLFLSFAMHYVLFLVLVGCTYTTRAQSNCTAITGKQIEIVGNGIPADSKAFFVAEIHGFQDADDFEFKLIEYLLAHASIKHVILERGNADAYLINQYMQKGDTAYRKFFKGVIKRDEYFNRFRELYRQHPFTVHGIDFERLEFVAAVQNILSQSDMAKNTQLYKFVTAMADSVTHVGGGKEGFDARTNIYDMPKDCLKRKRLLWPHLGLTDFQR